MVSRQEGWSLDARRLVRGGLVVGSIGLVLHLVLLQTPGIERSLRLVAETAHLMVGAAFLAEFASEVCYAELLGRSVGVLPRSGTSRRSRGPGRWFMLRLTLTGYGAAHVLPGGGATAAAVTYGALRRRGLDPERVGLALAAVTILVYAALGALFAGSLLYMLVDGDLDPAGTAASFLFLALLLGLASGAYVAYRRPTPAKNIVQKGARLAGRLLKHEGLRRKMEVWSVRLVSRLGGSYGRRDSSWSGIPQRR